MTYSHFSLISVTPFDFYLSPFILLPFPPPPVYLFWNMEGETEGSAKTGSALPLCFPTNLRLFPPLLSWWFRFQRLALRQYPTASASSARPVLINEAQLGFNDLYQVRQGWQQLLVRHWLCPTHWRVNTATESHQAQHAEAAEAARKHTTDAGGMISCMSLLFCMVSPNIQTWHRIRVTGTCS